MRERLREERKKDTTKNLLYYSQSVMNIFAKGLIKVAPSIYARLHSIFLNNLIHVSQSQRVRRRAIENAIEKKHKS